jgi:hypothetical protein
MIIIGLVLILYVNLHYILSFYDDVILMLCSVMLRYVIVSVIIITDIIYYHMMQHDVM